MEIRKEDIVNISGEVRCFSYTFPLEYIYKLLLQAPEFHQNNTIHTSATQHCKTAFILQRGQEQITQQGIRKGKVCAGCGGRGKIKETCNQTHCKGSMDTDTDRITPCLSHTSTIRLFILSFLFLLPFFKKRETM